MFKAAIVGCGRIASDFDNDSKRKDSIATHAGAYKFCPETELLAAADIEAEQLRKFGKKWNIKNLYSDYGEMLKKEKIDILSICTPSSVRLDICKKAVEAGVKAIFCEKPMAETLAEADEMIRLCGYKVILAVNHLRRWDRLHQDIQKYIEDGKLGNIQHVDTYYTSGIANTGVHRLDLLRFFFGEVAWVWSNFDGKENEVDPTVDTYLYFKSGVSAAMHGMNVKDYLISEVDIYGSKGRIRIENSGYRAVHWDVIEHPKFSGYKCLQEKGPVFEIGLRDTMVRAVEDIVSCIKSGGKPMSSGNDGRAVLELISAAHESGKNQKGARVYLPLKKTDIVIKSK